MRNIFMTVTLYSLLLGGSCDHPNEYHTFVRGKIINSGSKTPIDSVLVVLKDGTASGDSWLDLNNENPSRKTKNFAYTNKQGNFEIEIYGINSASLGLSKKGYSYEYREKGFVVGFKPYSEGFFENEILEMEADAWFKPIFKSTETSTDTDTVTLEMLIKERSDYDIRHNNPYGSNGFGRVFKGKGPFTYRYTSEGDTYQIFKITLNRNSLIKTKIDSVYIKSFETYIDTIYY